jgi:DNA-binding response OmpR family regulator
MNKVLIINPDRKALARYKNILDRDGLRVLTAATAEEGLRIHREVKVNLILAELNLPDMGGDVLCSRIRQEEALRKVSIIVDCNDVPKETARVKGCGANALLLKPVTPERLEEGVRKLLDVPPRQDCRVLVKAQVFGNHGATTVFGTSRNISVAGLLIESDEVLAVGERISCMFFLPGPRQISAVGEIVRTSRPSSIMHQYGIRFLSLYPPGLTEIENFIANSQAA